MKKRLLVAAAAALLLVACGKEVSRVPFSAPGTGDTTAVLKAGDVDFWTDVDVEHQGPAAVVYHIDLQQNGASVATATCDALGRITAKGNAWTETNFGNNHTRHGDGKMNCSATLATGGPTTVKVTLGVGVHPPTLRKADLIVKQ